MGGPPEKFSASIRIRPYESRDLDQAVDVWFTSWVATFPWLQHPWPRGQWRSHFEAKLGEGASVFIVEEHARIIGFLLLFEASGRLDQIFVRPGEQGRGVGTSLLELAKQRCPRGLHLDTQEANDGARRFYERHGFSPGKAGVNAVNGQPNIEYTWTPSPR